MKVFAGIAVLLAGTGTASAAWNNVAQPTCNNCRSHSSFFAPAADCCPQPCPQVCYKQRCYYQPYTAYRMESVCVPVTTYRTSYYWEPVTTYRYTSYYDPCTGCCQQVATPCTSYRLRSQCNAVQSYVQRCQMVPYTAYRQSCYLEPVVSYTPPPNPCPAPAPAAGISEPPTSAPGGAVIDPNRKPLPGVSEDNRTLPPQNIPNNRNGVAPNNGAPIRTDRIASNGNGRLQGTVVADDRITPKGNARMFFSSVEKRGEQYSVQADPTGRFNVELPPGNWTLYLNGNDGKAVYHSQISVRNNDQRLVTVVSR